MCPHKPGVYLMKDRFGTVIYVGQSPRLAQGEFRSTFIPRAGRGGTEVQCAGRGHSRSRRARRPERAGGAAAGRQTHQGVPAALQRQLSRRQTVSLLKVNLNDPIPRFTLTRLKQDDGARYFGPFANSGALRRTLMLVRQKFNLRGCRPFTPAEADYKHCLYAHLKVCTAPCIGNVSREQYLLQVRAACEFLAGQCEEMQETIQAEMQKAARELDFEKAAQLRDLLADLKRTTQKTEKFERLPYKLAGRDGSGARPCGAGAPPRARRPSLRIEGFDISNISGTFAVASMVSFKNGRPTAPITAVQDEDRHGPGRLRLHGRNDPAPALALAERRALVAARPARVDRVNAGSSSRARHCRNAALAPTAQSRSPVRDFEFAGPDPDRRRQRPAQRRLCGIGQTGVEPFAVIGLAKEFEEIYRPGESEPSA